LLGGELILHSDHEAVKFIQGQHKLNPKHAKWVKYLQFFHFIIHHEAGKLNKDTNALLRRYLQLSTFETMVLGFEKTWSMLKEHYYWLKMPKYVEHFVKRCPTCQLAKSHVLS